MHRLLPIIVILISVSLLIPGVSQPILTISGTIEKSELTQAGIEHLADGNANAKEMLSMMSNMLGLDSIEGEVQVFKKTRSILGTVEELYLSGNIFVAALVGLFSIIIPALKLVVMLIQQMPISGRAGSAMSRLTDAIGKWSMADVFIVAIIVSYMAGNASAGMGALLNTQANFEVGFYYFSAYCIFSILSGVLVSRRAKAT